MENTTEYNYNKIEIKYQNIFVLGLYLIQLNQPSLRNCANKMAKK